MLNLTLKTVDYHLHFVGIIFQDKASGKHFVVERGEIFGIQLRLIQQLPIGLLPSRRNGEEFLGETVESIQFTVYRNEVIVSARFHFVYS